jgi:hypothetical protein
MKPLAIVISFDVSEQIVPGSIPGWVASLVHEFGFDRAKAAFHRGIVLTISRPAHGLDYPGCIEDLAVIGSGVLAAAIGMMDQAWRRLLALDGHGQCAIVKSARLWSRIAQPTIFLVKSSSTTAR